MPSSSQRLVFALLTHRAGARPWPERRRDVSPEGGTEGWIDVAALCRIQADDRGQRQLTNGREKTWREICMAGALPQESGLFSLVEMETADETVLVAVPMTTEIRGRTRRDSAEWAKEVFHQHKKNVKIIRARLKLSNVPIVLRLSEDVLGKEQI
jgi:hypothetical protein